MSAKLTPTMMHGLTLMAKNLERWSTCMAEPNESTARALLKRGLIELVEIAADADVIMPCWGNTTKVPPSIRHQYRITMDAISGYGKPIKAFGLTKGGDPLHPLMLGYATAILTYDRPEKDNG